MSANWSVLIKLYTMDPVFRERMQKVADTQAASPKSPVISEEKFDAITNHLLHPEEKVSPS